MTDLGVNPELLETCLRTQNKEDFACVDAKNLAEGQIDELKWLQIKDEGIVSDVQQRLARLDHWPTWDLFILLGGKTYKFLATLDANKGLFFEIIGEDN